MTQQHLEEKERQGKAEEVAVQRAALASPTEENWPALNQLYLELAGRMGREQGLARRDAMLKAAAEMGAAMNPPMTGQEFNSARMRYMNRLANAKRWHNHKPSTKPGRSSLGAEILAAAFPADSATTKAPSLRDQVRNLLAGQKRGEVRFLVTTNKQAVSAQRTVKHVTDELGWAAQTSVFPHKAQFAGQPVTVIAIKRLK